jgi:hypothetical protein
MIPNNQHQIFCRIERKIYTNPVSTASISTPFLKTHSIINNFQKKGLLLISNPDMLVFLVLLRI